MFYNNKPQLKLYCQLIKHAIKPKPNTKSVEFFLVIIFKFFSKFFALYKRYEDMLYLKGK